METERNCGKKADAILALLLAVGWLCGCQTPYSSNATPKASASISDEVTSGSLEIGAVGEFTFVATHCHMQDGPTTGTVTIHMSKDTVNHLGTSLIGVAAGYVARMAGL